MKRTTTSILNGTIIGLFCLVPFYAFLSVAIGSALHIYEFWRLWPEALLVVLSALASWRLATNLTARQAIAQNLLAKVTIVYTLVLLVAVAVTFVRTNIGYEAILQGAIMDMRLPVALLVGLVLAPLVQPVRLRWIITPAAIVIAFGLSQAFVLPYDSLKHVGYGAQTIPAVTLVDQKVDYARLQSTLRGPNPLGAYMVIVLAAGFVWLGRSRRWVAGLFVLMGLIVLFYSYSRSAYVGFVVTLIAVAWLALARYRRLLIIGAVSLLAVFLVGLVALRHNDKVQNVLFHTDETSQSSRSSNEDRASALQSGSRDVLQHPLGGGIGSAGPASVHSGEGGKIAENYYLQVGQETGWLGLGLFLALNALVLRALYRLRGNPLAIVFAASGFGLIIVNLLSHAWTDPTLAYVWWLGAGLIVGSAILPGETLKKYETKSNKSSRTKAIA